MVESPDPTVELALAWLQEGQRAFVDNTRRLTLDEALATAGGYRSILGIAKHVAGWSAVYHSYAFDAVPRHWDQTGWPRGLRDSIEPTKRYADDVLEWFEESSNRWMSSVRGAGDLTEPRPLHWGDVRPLKEIVVMVAAHWMYHAGEVNAILAVTRGEAWEYGEEVEENHVSTKGHGVRPAWMSDGEAAPFER